MMSKLIKIIFALMLIMPIKCFAEAPDISAGETRFDISSGCYVLKNNVRVVARGRTMTANEAKVQIMSQKVWANGDVTLIQDGITFNCDSIFVEGKKKSVDILGSVNFVQDGIITIKSNIARFSWDNKTADFYGRVNVDAIDTSKLNFDEAITNHNIDGIYDHVQYQIREKKIILLEKTFDNIPEIEIPEPDPQDGDSDN